MKVDKGCNFTSEKSLKTDYKKTCNFNPIVVFIGCHIVKWIPNIWELVNIGDKPVRHKTKRIIV